MEIKADIESSTKRGAILDWWETLHMGDWYSLERARHYLHGFRMALDATDQLKEEIEFLYSLCSNQVGVYAIDQAQEAA